MFQELNILRWTSLLIASTLLIVVLQFTRAQPANYPTSDYPYMIDYNSVKEHYGLERRVLWSNNSLNTDKIKGSGAAYGWLRIPPCQARVAHWHPYGAETNVLRNGKVDVALVMQNHTVHYHTLQDYQMVTYPMGLTHALHNPYKETVDIYVVYSTENPGSIPVNQFFSIEDEWGYRSLGVKPDDYRKLKADADVTVPIDHAKGGDYEKCLKRLGLPVPSPNKIYNKEEL